MYFILLLYPMQGHKRNFLTEKFVEIFKTAANLSDPLFELLPTNNENDIIIGDLNWRGKQYANIVVIDYPLEKVIHNNQQVLIQYITIIIKYCKENGTYKFPITKKIALEYIKGKGYYFPHLILKNN